jgi:hypothetical protein
VLGVGGLAMLPRLVKHEARSGVTSTDITFRDQ